MSPDPFKQLLQRADAQCEPAVLPVDEMFRRVAGAARRQRQRRVMAVAAVIPAALTLFSVSLWRHSPEIALPQPGEPAIAVKVDTQPPAEELQQALAEVAALEAEANFHLQVARRIIAERDRDASFTLARMALTDAEPAEVVRERLDLVAYRMIARADLLRGELHPNEDPVEIYRNVVRLFPDTHSAAEAKLRLAELNPIEPPGGA